MGSWLQRELMQWIEHARVRAGTYQLRGNDVRAGYILQLVIVAEEAFYSNDDVQQEQAIIILKAYCS